MSFRLTIRGDNLELRGQTNNNDLSYLADLAAAMEPFGLVIASPIEEN